MCVYLAKLLQINNSKYRFAGMSYDSENMRIRIVEEDIYRDGERDAYDELFLHKEVSRVCMHGTKPPYSTAV